MSDYENTSYDFEELYIRMFLNRASAYIGILKVQILIISLIAVLSERQVCFDITLRELLSFN